MHLTADALPGRAEPSRQIGHALKPFLGTTRTLPDGRRFRIHEKISTNDGKRYPFEMLD